MVGLFINQQFFNTVNQGLNDVDKLNVPTSVITEGFFESMLSEDQVFNKIFNYLLSQDHDPDSADIIREFHQFWITSCTEWLTVGQQHGSINPRLNPAEIASYFVTYCFGIITMRRITNDAAHFNISDVIDKVTALLRVP